MPWQENTIKNFIEKSITTLLPYEISSIWERKNKAKKSIYRKYEIKITITELHLEYQSATLKLVLVMDMTKIHRKLNKEIQTAVLNELLKQQI